MLVDAPDAKTNSDASRADINTKHVELRNMTDNRTEPFIFHCTSFGLKVVGIRDVV